MKIIRFMGGLGNQLFQYSFYRKMQILYQEEEVKADISYLKAQSALALTNVFDITLSYASQKEVEKATNCERDYYHKIRRKIFGRDLSHIFFEKQSIVYDPSVWDSKKTLYEGYWQSEKYFSDIKRELLLELTRGGVNKLSIYQKKKWEEIKNTNSVGIHIRRGDYLTEENQKIYGNICTLEYYKNAIEYLENREENIIFYIFSNDIEWVKSNLKKENMVYLEPDPVKGDFDIILMSQCNHLIIANSSFSWWGAWLNQNKNKIIISPSQWLNGQKKGDIWCDSWIKM